MRKSDKKLDNQIRLLLTDFCENTLKQYAGFNWITHTVNYQNFPQSLHITIVFQDTNSLILFTEIHQQQVQTTLANRLSSIGINTRSIKRLVSYDIATSKVK